MNQHDIAASTRGTGLMRQLHLMRDLANRVACTADDDFSAKLPRILRVQSLLARASDVIHVAPPLTTTRPKVDEIIDRLYGVWTTLKHPI